MFCLIQARFSSTMRLTMGIIAITSALLLSACGGGGGNSGGGHPPATLNGTLTLDDQPVAGLPYTTDSQQGHTSTTGQYHYQAGESVTVTLGDQTISNILARTHLTESDLATAICAASSGTCDVATVTSNLTRLLRSLDADSDISNGIELIPELAGLTLDLTASTDVFETALAKQLTVLGRAIVSLFRPSLGINLEAPQAESHNIIMPIPFVDLFRIATPFTEYSCSQNTYDTHGWVTAIPDACKNEIHPIAQRSTFATTQMATFQTPNALPEGKYIVLYEGNATVQYAGIGEQLQGESTPGRHVVEITKARLNETWRANTGLRMIIKDIVEPVKNIRVVMPGGTCAGNPAIHVMDASECPANEYQSFEERLATNRNEIIFNPAYLTFLKDFHTIRMMNFMEASPHNTCKHTGLTGNAYNECLMQDFTWGMRAKVNDASWGATFLTPKLERYGRGAPIEVQIELANQLHRNPWFVLPHNATDDYIDRFATLVRNRLDNDLKAVVEYSNEPWNGAFWVYDYTQKMGMDAGMGSEFTNQQYWAGILYYTKRASEMFERWEQVFGGTNRLIRVLNTYHRSTDLTNNMLVYLQNESKLNTVDVIASAPYFYGCWTRSTHSSCADTDKVPMTLSEVTSLDDVFAVMDNADDVYSLPSVLDYIQAQSDKAAEFGKAHFTYEGGQHLTLFSEIPDETRKDNLLDLFQAANRDPRMKARYLRLLNGWKKNNGALFTLFTLPQEFNDWGSFGIKETLDQPRSDAPKYDGAIQFQEKQQECWWTGCRAFYRR